MAGALRGRLWRTTEERVFCVSVRADLGQGFSFPEPVELEKRLVDVLEPLEEIDERYFLSDGYTECFVSHSDRCKENGVGYRFEPIERGCDAV